MELSVAEEAVAQPIKRARLFRFLRRRGPICSMPPAKLALTTLLQAYTGASDDEAIEALVMDRRWQSVLDCLVPSTRRSARGPWCGSARCSSRKTWIGA